ncbi:MAG: hypothetical protein RRC07_02065 [Anaerolineae bacterium]|nr:hypothetical protein [Anaerolineae bacterium]
MMTFTRSQLAYFIVAVLAVAILLPFTPGATHLASAQTVPTITPTPPPGQAPTATPGNGGPGPTDEPPPPASPTPRPRATNTRPPAIRATATATGQAPGGASPTPLLSGAAAAWATAEPCSDEPTVRVGSRGAWVYDGPGEDYERAGRLSARTVRPIVARAAVATWWQIELDGNDTVWIADNDVTVQGDTSQLPVMDAPPLPDGATPTPGPAWEPTPNPRCAEATATVTATVTRASETPTASPSPSPTSTVTLDAAEATANVSPGSDAEAAAASDDDGSSTLFWLPVAGIVLLAAGVFLYVTRRT